MTYRRWLFLPVLFLIAISTAVAYISPGSPTGYVNDFADILTPEQENNLESKLIALAAGEGSEMSVVTVANLGGDTVENFAVGLFDEWGIGKKDKDNGLLLLIALEERELRLEVGYGLEGTITDAQAFWIVRDILTPAFKNGDYYGGINGAVGKVTEAITGATILPSAEEVTPKTNGFAGSISLEFIVGAIAFLATILSASKSYWLGGVLGLVAGVSVGILYDSTQTGLVAGIVLGLFGLLIDFFLSRGGGTGSDWTSGGSGGSRSSRGGGGFGGFGGGRSGGGGSSGRW